MFMRMEFMTCKVREWFQWMRWHVSDRMNQPDCWNIETLCDSTTNFISFSIYELLWNCRMEPVVRGTRYRWTPLAIFSRPSKSVSDNIWSIEWNQFSLWCSDALRWKIFSPIWWCGENIRGGRGGGLVQVVSYKFGLTFTVNELDLSQAVRKHGHEVATMRSYRDFRRWMASMEGNEGVESS